MEPITKSIAPDGVELKGEGGFEIAFSPFDVVDLDKDIVRRTALEEGAKLPLLWAHESWSMPVGTGAVKHSSTHAVLVGDFIGSSRGQDARATLKETKEFQEFSWGFFPLETNAIQQDGESVREIVKADPIEVSAVLRGAAGYRQTETLAVKTRQQPFKDEIAELTHAVASALKRAQDLKELRTKNDQAWPGPETRELLARLHVGLGEAGKGLAALLEEPDSEEIINELKEMRERFLAQESA